MQYMMQICNNIIVNTYLTKSNMQDVKSEYSMMNDGHYKPNEQDLLS